MKFIFAPQAIKNSMLPTFVCVGIVVIVYEAVRKLVYMETFSRWQSHITSFIVIASLTTIAASMFRTRKIKLLESLLEKETKLRGLYELSPVGFVLTDMDGQFIEFNESFRGITGYADEELGKLRFQEITPDRYSAEDALQMGSLIHSGRYGPYEKEYRRKDGSLVPIRLSGVCVTGSDARQYNWSVVEDISERRERETKLRLGASVFSGSDEAIVIIDEALRIAEVNPAFSRLSGYSGEDIIGYPFKQFISKRHSPEIYSEIWKTILTDNTWKGNLWGRSRNGDESEEFVSISALRNDSARITHLICTFSEIKRVRALVDQLGELAYFDPLTGAPNRRLFSDRFHQAISSAARNGTSLVVCCLDLNEFKAINDRYGHAAGDRVLIAINNRLHGMMRAEDTLARIGGDEFAMLLNNQRQTENIHLFLERVLSAVSMPLLVSDTYVQVYASIGYTIFPEDNVDADTLLCHADQAMYMAKQTGEGCYLQYTPRSSCVVNA